MSHCFQESGIALVVGAPERVIARYAGRSITGAEFLGRAAAVAVGLPDRPYAINLCENRYHFAVAFAAAMLRGQISLFPPSRAPLVLDDLQRDYPGAYRLTDDELLRFVDLGATDGMPDAPNINAVAVDRTVAIVFTSGSTGQPQAHPKSWKTFSTSARLIGDALHLAPSSPATLIATVPPQHMYGLELSVLLPLCHGGVLDEHKPFFPADVRQALEAAPSPRWLITTPVHLRACIEAGLAWPVMAGIVSATAPLDTELAVRAEAVFRAPVREIYGFTEAGSIASRRSVEGPVWSLFDGVRLVRDGADGCGVEAEHLPQPLSLNDAVEILDARRFELKGRLADMVNIAGKRTTLAALNHALLAIDGVADGAFFLPDSDADTGVRLTAFAVAPASHRRALLDELSKRIDPVFLPRPLYLVDSLPRSETGKLTRQALRGMLERLRFPAKD